MRVYLQVEVQAVHARLQAGTRNPIGESQNCLLGKIDCMFSLLLNLFFSSKTLEEKVIHLN